MEIKGTTYLFGDLHGKITKFKQTINFFNITNSNLIILGDCGVGFDKVPLEKDYLDLYYICKKTNNKLYMIRGNHDNPDHWLIHHKEILEKYNITLLHDGTITINDNKFLIVSGGISVDRKFRALGFTYWESEKIGFPVCKSEKIYGVLAHVGPNPPVIHHKVNLDNLMKHDLELDYDLKEEQKLVNDIILAFKPDKWFYGHYHTDTNFNYIVHDSSSNENVTVNAICLGELSPLLL